MKIHVSLAFFSSGDLSFRRSIVCATVERVRVLKFLVQDLQHVLLVARDTTYVSIWRPYFLVIVTTSALSVFGFL